MNDWTALKAWTLQPYWTVKDSAQHERALTEGYQVDRMETWEHIHMVRLVPKHAE